MPNRKQQLRELTGQVVRRSMDVLDVRGIDEESRTLELAFSSDAEIERWPGFVEVLDHSPGAVRLDRIQDAAPCLFNHDKDDHLGIIESAQIDADGKGRARVRFGSGVLASEKFNDAKDGILRHVSVGYRIIEIKLKESREDGTDVYIVTDWEPHEISLVTIPADTSVGVGRSHDDDLSPEDIKPKQEARDMPVPEIIPEGAKPPAVNETEVREAALKTERERTDTLLTLGREYNAPDEAQRLISEGGTPDQFRQLLLERTATAGATPDEQNEPVGLSDAEIRKYSFLKVLRALDPNNHAAREKAAFELEVSAAAAMKLGREATGIVIPTEVLMAPLDGRVYTSDNTGAPHGGALISTDLKGESFIGLLRKRCLLMQLGTQLAGLVGNIDIPKQISGATGYVVGEDNDAPESEGDFGQVSMSPTTIGALSEISRRTLMQSSVDIEAMVRADLAKALGLKIDNLGFYGTGTAEPLGIKNTTGVNAVNFATAAKPTHTELIQMESEVAADDADVESMAYLFNAKMRGHCKSTPKFANGEATIWEQGNTVNGYTTGVTNQVADGDVFHGNFADLLIGLWGGLELTLDPYTHSAKGRLRIVAMQDVDYAVRHGESFCYGVNTP